MFFIKQHNALLKRLEEKIKTVEQTVTGQRTQLDAQISDIRQNIAKLHASANKQNMILEDLIEEWSDRESDEEQQFRTTIRRAEKAIKDRDVQNVYFLCRNLEDAIYELKEALAKEDLEAAEEAEGELLFLLDMAE